ncbi:hypothetical protein AB0K64_21280 [Streptomyces sp. NPDC053741]|uniref:Uncharacterized protein n=1 Tax=[Kitasatospora] papulosa TaxID=1464011 RepID=A0ABZ1JX59_9ACTN|nr:MULTISPECIES: hypothetical protein [unclassified Streptomyces]MDF6061081.1 hypothetical protein [Streptomyces sp. JH010]MEE1776156.1 hypothetical protein [Streptomyces sp. JV181]RAS25917.1 hypothetical protein BCL80_11118 [Streptomyces avidinii]SNX80614.1 hypothetical protein SAMN05421860_111178 [Streptomyces microflavus]
MNLTGAVVSLAVAAWLIWLFPAPHLAAVLGVGPVDGVMTITSCYGATDVEGYPDGTDCSGTYTPRATGGSPRRITLDKAAESHDPGSVLEVRTVRGRAHELSGDALGTWVTVTVLILGPFLALALSFRACARDNTWSHNADYVAVLIAAEIAALVLGFLVDFPVSIAMALFG